MSKLSITELFELVRLAILCMEQDVDIQKRMASYGFPPKRIQEAKALRQQTMLLHDAKEDRYDEGWALSQQLSTDMEKVLAAFKEHVKVARTAFRTDPVLLHALKIKRIATRRWEWPVQALNFYTKLETRQASMTPFGISQEELQQTKASVEAILDQKAARIRKKGEAQGSTQQRNQAIKTLHAWLTEFHGIARIAFKDNPQTLESFGILVPSAK